MPRSKAKQHFLEIGDSFANYTIVQFCGSGAYGEVYLAEDITHKVVALKVIPISSGSEVWRMELIGLRHYRQSIDDYHALIEVLHVGETDNYFYYTMEAADNMLHSEDEDEYIADTLAHRLERGGRLEPDKVLELANSLLDALEHLAEHDLAHRDIKPANIVFINGQAKLSDIGLISTTGVRSKVVGTLDFLPPEIADGDPVGYGHDLYALGKVLYCALTGLVPENYPEIPLTVPLRAWRQFKTAILRACSPDPRQRFYTPADFREALPSSIKPTTWIDESCEHVRSYKKQHPVAWRLSIISVLLIAGAIALSAGFSYYLKWQLEKAKKARIDFIFRTIDMINDRQVHLQRIAAMSGNSALPRRLQIYAELAAEARANGDIDATERYCKMADTLLRRWAQEELDMLLKRYPAHSIPPDNNKLFKLLMHYSDFSYSPLIGYLNKQSQELFANTLGSVYAHLHERWAGPMPGSNWSASDDPDLVMTYVPRGILEDEPRHSFWIGVNEVTGSTAARLLAQSGITLPGNHLPAHTISWNDRIDLCRILTVEARNSGTLPPGYIYRLPYKNEWLFLISGAWASAGNFIHEHQLIKDYAWYGGNSKYELHEVRTLQPGNPGLYDLIGNAAESVVIADYTTGKALQTGNFGGSFRDRRISSKMQESCAPDMFANNWSGLRIVLAPGNMEYFTRNWYTGSVHKIELDNNIYEVLGSPYCRWTGHMAFQWCKLLGGEAAILNDANLRDKLFDTSKRLRELPVLIGATGTVKGWIWLDKTPVYDGEWLNGRADSIDLDQGNYMVWDHSFWRGINGNTPVPLLLIKYSKKRPQRVDYNTDSPLIIKKFQIGSKKYWVLNATVDWHTAKRLTGMLGGKLAVPENAAEEQQLFEALKEHSHLRLAVGAYRQCGSWVWLNGKAANVSNIDSQRTRSLNESFVCIYNHRISACELLDGLVCEF